MTAAPAQTRPRILVVDDEPRVLSSLTSVLRRQFDVVSAGGGAAGLEVVARGGEVAAVISDYQMPGMNGAEFLGQVRQLAPAAPRILLTGQVDLAGAIAAVNRGYIFRLLTKPCPVPDLQQAVEDAIDQARLAGAERELLARKLAAVSSHLFDAERLATLGTMAGAVGHELVNIVATFDAALEGVREHARTGRAPETCDLAVLGRMRDHLATHGRHLLHLGRPARDGSDCIDLCRAVTDALTMLRSAAIPRHFQLEVSLPPEPALVRIGQTRFEQVLVNLVKNAVDALAIPCDRRPALRVGISRDDAAGVVACHVEDNGCGIPEDQLAMIFEPYCTTKARDRGTGLGLFVVKQIIDACGGDLTVASQLGQRTSFTFRLPLG